MKNIKVWILVLGIFLVAFIAGACQQASSGGDSGGTGYFLTATENTTPVVLPSASGRALSAWGSGNTMYDIFYLFRQYVHPDDEGVIDRANLYRLLYDVDTLFTAMTTEVVALSAAQVIVPPFNFGNNYTYNKAVNNTSSEMAAATYISGNTVRGIVSWIWRDATDTNHDEFGILEVTKDTSTDDISIDFVFCVDYDSSDTVCDYNNRTKISGNAGTHAFEFVRTLASSTAVTSQMVGKGISQGVGNVFLLKIKDGNNDGFTSTAYMVVSAEATEATLQAMDASSEAITDPASLPATVASYKSYVETTSFYSLAEILTDIANLNTGNPKTGTIYINY
ncbi:MAG: hypothetical protein KKB81_00025 [Candidatus Margulisbacteria bacterium]|nr:hypothetical protein [Candidatus Margulisiibacteriota bacterium]MBU1022341.1 hypothetical protein [Candidatus Margulisiibacteriota bacterium]MBU1729107.1 hypothetical protein [Candidatus Margulisiibacteriota bacterium]MBU1954472.1 hypothetical protein [Candidatus Margulisiibacteriota bacterium]